jgi:hypothetical protein
MESEYLEDEFMEDDEIYYEDIIKINYFLNII